MPPRIQPPIPSITSTSSIFNTCSLCLRRQFSSTPAINTRLRKRMFQWLEGPGRNFQHPRPNATNYLTNYNRDGTLSEAEGPAKPFPLNPLYVSESILSEPLRLEIWKRVRVEGKSVRQVSVELGVEMRRVGAVVRLVEVERRMRAEGKSLALPYARAIHSMIPITEFNPESANVTSHESINDLPMHRLTKQQIFYPTSESRAFNRVDAGRVFSGAPRLPDSEDVGQGGKPAQEPWRDTKIEIIGRKGFESPVLKPADARIPHPELIAYEIDRRDPKFRNNEGEIKLRYAERFIKDAEKQAAIKAKKEAEEEARKTRVDTLRWQFVVTDVQATRDGTGLDGRGTKSPGFRYGVPAEDRKRGQIKIPTKVEV